MSLRFAVIASAFLGLPSLATGQAPPAPADVATLDGILAAYYEVVSGPAGQARDWARDSTLHHARAQVTIVGDGEGGRAVPRVMTLGDYHRASSGLATSGFLDRKSVV